MSELLYIYTYILNGDSMKPAHRDTTKRNRNIGTAKQGHGQDNRLTIPDPLDSPFCFYERLTQCEKSSVVLHGKERTILVEELHEGYFYSCTPTEIIDILNALPEEDLTTLSYIVLRQPKKKEVTLSPVWGRSIFDFQSSGSAAIILEAVPSYETLALPKKLSVEQREEMRLLEEDGLHFQLRKRFYTAAVTPEHFKAIQLYRTLLHEVGHLKHFAEVSTSNDTPWKSIPTREKESYANQYAIRWKRKLMDMGIIPVTSVRI